LNSLLGFDYGTRKIGVAVGQKITQSATPLLVLRNRNGQPDWSRIQALIQEWQPEAAVIGLPLNMDDSETALAPRVRRFARQIDGRFGLRVHLADERLSSQEARAQRGASGASREPVDALAAALILETWLREP